MCGYTWDPDIGSFQRYFIMEIFPEKPTRCKRKLEPLIGTLYSIDPESDKGPSYTATTNGGTISSDKEHTASELSDNQPTLAVILARKLGFFFLLTYPKTLDPYP